MLIRGKDIAPDLHEKLLYYQYLLNQFLSGKIQLEQLNDEDILNGLETAYVGNFMSKPSPILRIYN